MLRRRTATFSATIPASRTEATMIHARPPAIPLFACRRGTARGFGLGLPRGAGRGRGAATAAASCQEGGRERVFQRSQFVVDGDSQRLEDPLRRMAVAEPGRGRNRGLDRLDEVAGALERSLAPASGDRTRDLLRISLLAVLAEKVRQF